MVARPGHHKQPCGKFELNSWSCLYGLRHAYAAGFYRYPWSEVVAADMRTPFGADKPDPAVGRRYRHTVLANGGQLPLGTLVRRFLGRSSNAKAFFEALER